LKTTENKNGSKRTYLFCDKNNLPFFYIFLSYVSVFSIGFELELEPVAMQQWTKKKKKKETRGTGMPFERSSFS
jgi:hypothetical protein